MLLLHRDMGNDHQRFKKLPFNEIDVQMAPILIILIVFIMICIMKDAQ